MKNLLLLLTLMVNTSVFAQFGTCYQPVGAFLLQYIDIDFSLDDGMNVNCPDLLQCINPVYDAYYEYYLDSGPYIGTIISGTGADSVYIAVMSQGCDTIFGEFCGVSASAWLFGLYNPGLYTITINSRSPGPFRWALVRGDITDEPYMKPTEDCGTITGMLEFMSVRDSVKVLQVGNIAAYRYFGRDGQVIGYRKYWEEE